MAPCNKNGWWGTGSTTAAEAGSGSASSSYESASSSTGLRLVAPVLLSLLAVSLVAIICFYLYKRYRVAVKPSLKTTSSDQDDIEMRKEAHVSDEKTDVDSDSVVKDEN
jgi:hypothetical protein